MVWTFVASCLDGEPLRLRGIDVWQGRWQKQSTTAVVQDPIYGRELCFDVWTLTAGNKTVRFAAGEFSNGVWGFYEEGSDAQDLFRYLVGLGALFENSGDTARAQRVLHVSKFVSGSTTEFYGEARLLLPRILAEAGDTLPEVERAKLRDIISRVERAFDRVESR